MTDTPTSICGPDVCARGMRCVPAPQTCNTCRPGHRDRWGSFVEDVVDHVRDFFDDDNVSKRHAGQDMQFEEQVCLCGVRKKSYRKKQYLIQWNLDGHRTWVDDEQLMNSGFSNLMSLFHHEHESWGSSGGECPQHECVYDCSSRELWTNEKQEWCCTHEQQGCSTRADDDREVYKGPKRHNCPIGQMVDSEELCLEASKKLGMRFQKSVSQAVQPAGCYWKTNGKLYFNKNLKARPELHIRNYFKTGAVCYSVENGRSHDDDDDGDDGRHSRHDDDDDDGRHSRHDGDSWDKSFASWSWLWGGR